MHSQPKQECQVGYATLHRAWSTVFWNYPDRVDIAADGYIATKDCSEIGSYKWLYFGGNWWHMKIADCYRRDQTPPPNWLVDVDDRLWLGLHVPITPTAVIICSDSYDPAWIKFTTNKTRRTETQNGNVFCFGDNYK